MSLYGGGVWGSDLRGCEGGVGSRKKRENVKVGGLGVFFLFWCVFSESGEEEKKKPNPFFFFFHLSIFFFLIYIFFVNTKEENVSTS